MLNQKEELFYREILNDKCELEKMIQTLKLVTETVKKSIVSYKSMLIFMSLKIINI